MKGMKKSFIITLALSVAFAAGISCVFAAEYTKFSKSFINKFEDCDPYEETENSQFEGEAFTTHRQIIGWRNGFCQYRETVSSKDGKYQLNCSFPSIQVDELYNAMKSKDKEPERFELELFGQQTDAKTGKVKYVVAGTQTIKGNKAYIVWTKYQNNPYFCTPKKL